MNPQVEQSPSLRLPQPSLESAQIQNTPETAMRPEQSQARGEAAPTPPMPPIQAVPVPQPLAPAPTSSLVGTVNAGDDSDDSGVDEEWINKAKQIVEHTHADPYVQSAELGKFKAEYLKSRHNKEIKVAEDSKK